MLQKLANLYKHLGETGFLTIILAAIVLCGGIGFYTVFTNMMRQQQTVLERLINQQITNTYEIQRSEHQTKFKKQLSIIPLINNVLDDFCEDANVEHIMIAEYHNSIENIASAAPFCKFTVTYETMNAYHKPMRNEFQNVNISNYKIMSELANKLYVKYKLSELKKNDKLLYYQLEGKNVKSLYICRLQCNDCISGFILIIQYDDKDIDINKLLMLSNKINKLLKS